MKTIERKLLVVFGSFIVAIILVELITNNFLLEKYYINENKEIFIAVGSEISDNYDGQVQDFEEYITSIDKEEGISVYVIDGEGTILYTSRTRHYYDGISKKLQEIASENKDMEGYTFGILEDTSYYRSSYKITLTKRLEDENYLILRKSIKGIQDSVDIANRFYIMVGIFIAIVGGGIAIYLSKRITKPIIEMSNVAESITKLDFSKQVDYHAPDEIGQLATSINTMSSQLNQNINQLRDDIEHRKQLFRNITHELKTPITVLKGYAEGLQYAVVDNIEDIQEYCGVIVDECNEMNTLVYEILSYSELEWSETSINKTSFLMGTLMKELMERYEKVMEANEIQFVSHIDTSQRVCTDYQLLERLLNNYIMNAINHVDDDKKIVLTLREEKEFVVCEVYNSGKAIPQEEANKIWQVFYKGISSNSSENVGHGLGLSIVKTIADILQLTVGFRNEESGVCFYVLIAKN
ncbi:sensor histidine kinase [Anaerosporobacter sp.]|uniref:sensor histidine kinase n=1 Tax=Anaerosporobacter sp. TaxID=1872529 RepID=UPI00286F56A9|nr:HAMP domain-containing sensor histidine kinase [Anaerosporobacter sp.]